jgi:1-acyl-sn-glycerol-3-phosphate acyltransferase
VLQVLAAVPRTVVTLLSGLIATVLMGTAAALVGHMRPTSSWVQRIILAWSRAWLVPAGVRLMVEGAELVDVNESYVVTANHLSNIDVMVCFAAIPVPIRYLAKRELFGIPILAQGMRAIGIVEVDRAHSRSQDIHDSINVQSQAVIERGHSLMIYPEGTRSRDGEPKPFRKGAFTMAVSTGMPLLPVTIHGTRQVWKPLSPWIRPGTVRVIIDRPIPTKGMSRSDGDELRDRVQSQTEARLEVLRKAAAQR